MAYYGYSFLARDQQPGHLFSLSLCIIVSGQDRQYHKKERSYLSYYLIRSENLMNNRHGVFVSYYHEQDQGYRERFELLFSEIYDIMESKSVEIGDIDPYLKIETIHQKIRDNYLRDSTVTVVLVLFLLVPRRGNASLWIGRSAPVYATQNTISVQGF